MIRHAREETRRQLRAQGSGVEQSRCRTHVVKRREQVVKLDRPGVRIIFFNGQTHGDTHEEYLWQFEANFSGMDEVAIVECLQAEVGELQVTFRLDCGAEKRQIELPECRCEQLQFDAFADERVERGWIEIRHLALRRPVVVLGIDMQEGQRLGA